MKSFIIELYDIIIIKKSLRFSTKKIISKNLSLLQKMSKLIVTHPYITFKKETERRKKKMHENEKEEEEEEKERKKKKGNV